jgi:hypothetical protein
MLKSYEAIYEHGKIEWLDEAPPETWQRILVVAESPGGIAEKSPAARRRQPSPKLQGTVTVVGDITAPLHSDAEWEAFSERTARQIAGDPKAFE